MHLSVLISVILATIALVAMSVKRIPEGKVYSVRRLGRPAALLSAGTHVVMPVIDRVSHKIDLNGQILHFDGGTVYWQVLEPERADAVIDHATDLIRTRAQAAMRDAVAHAVDRSATGKLLKQVMNGSLRDNGMLVTRVELDAVA
ncbi:regulator of protease activity HflC (stomatin/prohibitin superfamily) [Luteibacter sp. Sphag1AF]|uniref:SPFH domain-containing protein n=1 Tax=Luteibacter sp. Sphag1AF TaxID=2587031 RepID=UPI0016089FE8|nr:hypothetical protein [Luteibacter sp. Sphag1AF]MBB3226679.1 regulator of protease activity HflC (stomatin/prohibitin superfamily) [Luteibacter sp. Sphag1AF]